MRAEPNDRRAAPERIVQRGGAPNFSPSKLLQRGHAEYDEQTELRAMVRANLVAERVAVETYRQMAALIGDEEEHADEPADLLAGA